MTIDPGGHVGAACADGARVVLAGCVVAAAAAASEFTGIGRVMGGATPEGVPACLRRSSISTSPIFRRNSENCSDDLTSSTIRSRSS